MKKYLLGALCVIALAVLLGAGWMDGPGNYTVAVNFLPRVFAKYTGITSIAGFRTQSHALSGTSSAVRMRGTEAFTYSINGTGAVYPVTAATSEVIVLPRRTQIVTSVVFTIASTATNQTSTIYVQED